MTLVETLLKFANAGARLRPHDSADAIERAKAAALKQLAYAKASADAHAIGSSTLASRAANDDTEVCDAS